MSTKNKSLPALQRHVFVTYDLLRYNAIPAQLHPGASCLRFCRDSCEMDPLSITASIVALLGAAKATSKGLRKLSKCSTANREIDALIKELDIIIALLQETTQLLKGSEAKSTRGKVLVEPIARLLKKSTVFSRCLAGRFRASVSRNKRRYHG